MRAVFRYHPLISKYFIAYPSTHVEVAHFHVSTSPFYRNLPAGMALVPVPACTRGEFACTTPQVIPARADL
jgi:hypothetical protein